MNVKRLKHVKRKMVKKVKKEMGVLAKIMVISDDDSDWALNAVLSGQFDFHNLSLSLSVILQFPLFETCIYTIIFYACHYWAQL